MQFVRTVSQHEWFETRYYRPKMRNKLVQAQVAFPLISNFSAHSVAKMDILSQILT